MTRDETPRDPLRAPRSVLETYIIRSGTPHLGPSWEEAMDALDALVSLAPDADDDLTQVETDRLAEALRKADYMNWSSDELAVKLAGTVGAIAAARLAARGQQ